MKKVIIQRHAGYLSGIPTGDWEKDKNLGHLTSEGIQDLIQKTEERLFEMGDVTQIKFLIVYSPTYWFDDPRLGQRAKETAEHISATISKNGSQVIGLQLDFRLGEALMFQTPFANFLRKQYGGQGPEFWKAFFKDIHRNERQKYGAEGPIDIAKRISLVVDNAVDFLKCSDGPTVVWIITHGDCTVPYGISLNFPIEEISEGYNEGLELEL